jgi:hypothetical protein
MSPELSVVGVALLELSLELDDLHAGFCNLL